MDPNSLVQRTRALFLELSCLGPEAAQERLDGLRKSEPEVHAEVVELFSGATVRVDVPTAPSGHDGAEGVDAGRVGDYLLKEEIGRGSYGIVYRAKDVRSGRTVALKLLQGIGLRAEEVVARFRREAMVAARLEHRGVCRIYEVGVEADRPFIAMEFVRGVVLSRRIKDGRQQASSLHDGTVLESRSSSGPTAGDELIEAVFTVEKAARALHAAHEAGVVHRDVKPGNIIVREDGDPVVLDFGLAREMESRLPALTQAGALLGSPAYMSPEQVAGQRELVDRRTDVWALGVTLYEAICWRRPFVAPSRHLLFESIRRHEPDDPRRVNPHVSDDLAAVVLAALDKDLRRRYQTAEAFADDLARVRRLQPVSIRRPTRWYRLRRWVQRNPVIAASMAVAMLALLAGTMIATRFAVRAGESAGEARSALAAFRDENERNLRMLGFLQEQIVLPMDAMGDAARRGRNTRDVTLPEILDRAAIILHRVFEADPVAQGKLLKYLGVAFRNIGDLEKAVKHEKRSAELLTEHLGPLSFEAFDATHNLATMYERMGRHDDARVAYQTVADTPADAVGPDTLMVWVAKGSAFCFLDQPEEALAAFDRVLTLDGRPENTLVAHVRRARLLASLDRHEEARRAYGDLTEMSPSAPMWNERAGHLESMGLHEEAVTVLATAIAEYSGDPGLHGRMVRNLEEQGAQERHRRELERWAQVNEHDATAWHDLAWQLLRWGRRAETRDGDAALAAARKAVALSQGENPRMLFTLALAHEQSEALTEATAIAEGALAAAADIDPELRADITAALIRFRK
ncbi:MAG: protein kinase [Planctomycetes bacterium]|nr:protein kinase [Planctomycetota bacterium]